MMMRGVNHFGKQTSYKTNHFSPNSKFHTQNLLYPNSCTFPLLHEYGKHGRRVEMKASPESAVTKSPSEGGLGQPRNSANFHPSVWENHFLHYDSNSYSLDSQERDLIDKVKAKLADEAGDVLALLELIDQLQRFGVAYHFEDEIDLRLAKFAESYPDLVEGKACDDDLYMVSLLFRLLRQHGYYVSSDAFNKFKDVSSGKFRESLAGNVLGILSLFEAGHMLVHGEVMLEEALAFTTSRLESVDEKRESPFIAKLARHALKQPIRQGYPRVEAWRYIRMYQDDVSCNETVLALAKLDFNSLQKLHQKEACDLMKWWKDRDFTGNLPFARDRMIECYMWALAVYFEPKFTFARRLVAKVIAIASVMDDMFDAYGTLEEMELFTQAVERWNTSVPDELPEYMKFFYRQLMNLYDEIEDEMARRGYLYRLDYAKHSMKDHTKTSLKEVKWFHQKYVPSIDEYVAVASTTIGHQVIMVHSLVGMGDVITEDAFKWLVGKPHELRSSAAFGRYLDDIVGHKFEHERGHVASSIHCLVKQHGCTEQEAEEMLRKWIFAAWKDINEACLKPLAVPMPILERNLNMIRSVSVFYGEGIDNFTHSTTTMKDVVNALLVNPLPL